MAIIGKHLAIASVGISCQTAYQLELHRALVEKVSGGDLEQKRTPFDWIMAPIGAATQMIHSREFFPADLAELNGPHKPYWPRMGVHFWHAKAGDELDFLKKHAHVADNWLTIRAAKRRVFIISNLQNNVGRVLADREPIDQRLPWDNLVALYGALSRDCGQCELHSVSLADRFDPPPPSPLMVPFAKRRWGAINLHAFLGDGSQWAGDVRQWARLLARIARA